MKDALECRMNITLRTESPLPAWLVGHAAWLYSNCHEGRDKRTATESLQGGRSIKPVTQFGKSILYKPFSSKGDTVD